MESASADGEEGGGEAWRTSAGGRIMSLEPTRVQLWTLVLALARVAKVATPS